MTASRRTGACVACGLPVADHFAADNRSLSCAELLDRQGQSTAAGSEQAARDPHGLRRALQASRVGVDGWPADQPVPAVMTLDDLLRFCRISRRTFYRHRQHFRQFEANGLVPGALRFNGVKVERVWSGETLRTRVFGAGQRAVLVASPTFGGGAQGR